jgi:phosphodiesterase/alkaline phosphatase D-like protein
VVAPEGYEGVVMNELMGGETQGVLTTEASKYLWQKGWWEQHQRLLEALWSRKGSRVVFSGDIHAQGATLIEKSGSLDMSHAPLVSLLVGPVSTSDATWPSSARGIGAATPDWMEVEMLVPTREVNGFSLMEFTRTSAHARLASCGGFDRELGEDGSVLQEDDIVIS